MGSHVYNAADQVPPCLTPRCFPMTWNSPLQEKLNNLAELIAKIAALAGLTLFTTLMIRFFVQLGTGEPVR